MKNKNGVPDRWLAYKNIGEPIAGTRFVSFKVPLGEKYFSKIHIDDRFSPSQLFDICPDLGLVIDLTNTTRYYDPKCFQLNGIKHIKVPCLGQRVPKEPTVRRFCNVVDEFLRSKRTNGTLIGVHCTHGVNRTGFMVCSYLIRCLFMNPREAISAFETARGHPIERQPYIDALLKLELPQYNVNDDTEDAEATSSSAPTTSAGRRGRNNYTSRRSFESAGPSRSRGSQSAAERLATPGRSTSGPWAPAPEADVDPWPPASGSASTSWSPSPGPVAGPSGKSSRGNLGPGNSRGGGFKKKSKKSAKRAKVQSSAASKQDSDYTESPWRNFRADPGPSQHERPPAATSSESRVSHFSRGRSARGRHRWEDGRPTSRHLAPPDHLPCSSPLRSSSSQGHFAGHRTRGRGRAQGAHYPYPHSNNASRGRGWGRGRGRGRGRSWGPASRGRGWGTASRGSGHNWN